MDSERSSGRLGPAAQLKEHLDPSFLCLPSTVRFPHPVIAHGELGLLALVVHPGVLLYDERSGKWFGPEDSVDPNALVSSAAIELAAAARAPLDRVTAAMWLPSGMTGTDDVPVIDQVIASPEPDVAAAAIEDYMTRHLSGASEPTGAWIGGYVSAALGPTVRTPPQLRRLLAATEMSLAKAIENNPIIVYGHEVRVADLVDPSFILPALAVAAHEDWRLATRRASLGTGFEIKLEPDPAALLGYRLVDIHPATPFTALAPIVATTRRCRDGDEFYFDEIIRQFIHWLEKNGLDATILDDIETRIATSG